VTKFSIDVKETLSCTHRNLEKLNKVLEPSIIIISFCIIIIILMRIIIIIV